MKFPLVIILFLLMSSSAYSESVVEVARSQIGQGEIGGNNRGPVVKKYTRGQEVPWCAAFVSWVRFRAGASRNYFLSARSYWTFYHRQRVDSPRAGDIICFSRGIGKGHVGIVERVRGDTITTIEGNVSNTPGEPGQVSRKTYKIGHIHNLLGFVRI